MIYILEVYRSDNRCSTGERKIGSYEFDRKDDDAMKREVAELKWVYPSPKFRISFHKA